jgi:enoyl-CoA hydratase/carnithine racemase
VNGFETILFDKDEQGIARITLNRPEALNAFNTRMRDELYEALSAIGLDDEVRATIIQGAGEKAFCAGADLKEFLTVPSAVAAKRIREVRDLWRLFLAIPQPLIAALHGYVIGSGVEIALFCDLRIASEDVVFSMPEVGLGILPAAGGTQTLPRMVGLSRALDMLLTGRRIEGAEALDCGLVTRLLPGDHLSESAEEIALRMASFDPEAVRQAKKSVLQGMDMTLLQGLELERRLVEKVRRKGFTAGKQPPGTLDGE